MSWLAQVLGRRALRNRCLDRLRAIVRGNASGDAFRGLD
jgi:hypothetical protein